MHTCNFDKYVGAHHGALVKLTWAFIFITISLLTITINSYTYPPSSMVNRRSPYPTSKYTNSGIDMNALTEMHVAMDELHRENQTISTTSDNINRIPTL